MIKIGPPPGEEKTSEKQREVKNPVKINRWEQFNKQSNSTDASVTVVYNENESKNKSPFITATELFAMEFNEIPTLVEPLLPKVGIVAFVGSSDTGKSSILRQLAYLVAEGSKTFLGFRIHSIYKRSIYVSTEDDEQAISTLLKKQFGRPLDVSKTSRLKYIFESYNLLSRLNEEMSANPVDLVVIDAFSDLYEGDLNANNKVRTFLNKYSDLAKKHKCLVIILHHTGKRTETLVPGKDNAIGSQGFEAKMRLMIEIRKDPIFPNIRHLCIVKGNYLKEEFKTHSIVTDFNDYMLFENLNCSVPFEALVKVPNERAQAQERASHLRGQSMSYSKISNQLKDEGLNYSKSTIGEWLKNR